VTEIRFALAEGQRFSPVNKELLRQVLDSVYGAGTPVKFIPSEPGAGVIGFGVQSEFRTLSPEQFKTYPNAEGFLFVAVCRYAQANAPTYLLPWPDIDPDTVLYLDIESHSVTDRWNMAPRDFFRLGQYAWGPTGEVILTTDYDTIIAAMERANGIVVHNGHNFDVSVLFGTDSTRALELAQQNRIFDTMVYANLVCPAPDKYCTRKGTIADGTKPENTLKWLSLDNLCFQLGLAGKIGDLKALAKTHGGFGMIPLDDPEFLEYARNDVTALQELTQALLTIAMPSDYDWREQLNAAIDAQNSRNGFRVDLPVALARIETLRVRREAIMVGFIRDYGFPTTGKAPWSSTVGKAAIMVALADGGITPENTPDWTLTATGNISLGGQTLIDITDGTALEDFGIALAELKGQRSLAQLAVDSMQNDGKVHPDITALQRSGRKSTTKPGLTVWTSRGKGAIEKSYFIADEGCKLLAFDYSQADQRIVAALSGDANFAKRFEEGADAHEMTGRVVFPDTYDLDPSERRQDSKKMGHSYAYRAGAKTLARSSKLDIGVCYMFIEKMEAAYQGVTIWQNRVATEGESGYVTNDWGRCMVVQNGRTYTQSPAMYGQSGTREIMVDALIRMLAFDPRIILWLKAQIHDELLFSIPETELSWAPAKIKELMECNWGPSDGSGQVIHFPVGVGPLSDTWLGASH